MGRQVKVVVGVPEAYADKIRQIIGDANGGNTGNYTHCSFSVKGTGRFIPRDGAHPAIGQIGELEEVIEERIEFSCEASDLMGIIRDIKSYHPYEEPSIDVYALLPIE
jgi:hypothetical protein